MVLKVMKNSLKTNCQKKTLLSKKKFFEKTNSDKKIFSEIFWSLEIFPSSDISKVHVKNNEFRI